MKMATFWPGFGDFLRKSTPNWILPRNLKIRKSPEIPVAQWAKSMLVFCGLKNTRTTTFWPGEASLNFEPKRESRREVKKTWDLTFEKCPKVENTWFCLPKRTHPGALPPGLTGLTSLLGGTILGLTSLLGPILGITSLLGGDYFRTNFSILVARILKFWARILIFCGNRGNTRRMKSMYQIVNYWKKISGNIKKV